MSRYTTEVRYICESLAGLDKSVGYSNVNEKTVISDLCEDCYNDIKSYIHDKIFERAKKHIKGLIN